MTDFTASRVAMVDCQIRPSDVTKYPIISAMLTVPREDYVPADKRQVAYSGDHLDIGSDRVVLDPRVLAKMLDSLNIQPTEMVLDLGCGLGYGAAVIAKLADFVVAVEEDNTLATDAQTTLTGQSVDNCIVVEAPLSEGASKHGPYDAVVIEGGVESMPASIIDQVKDGGRIVAIFNERSGGKCCIGVKLGGLMSWRTSFDATAPVLPGFEKAEEFSL